MNTKGLAVIALALLFVSCMTACVRKTTIPSSAQPSVLAVDESNFQQEVLGSSTPVFIEFFATWCGPCKQQAPLVEQAARDFAGRVKFVKIDVDKSPRLAQAFRVRLIPTMYVVKNHPDEKKLEIVAANTGSLDLTALEKLIETGLK